MTNQFDSHDPNDSNTINAPITQDAQQTPNPIEPEASTEPPDEFDPLGEDFLSTLPDSIRAAALRVDPSLFRLTESELLLRVYPPAGKRTRETFENDNRIRALFWLEHERATNNKSKMVLKNVYQDVMLPANFLNTFLRNERRVAWMLLPFGSHVANVAALLKKGTDRLSEILDLPLVRQICRCHWGCVCRKSILEQHGECACDGSCICPPITDTKVGELIIKIYEKLELRAKGSVPQVINQRINSMNLNLNKNVEELPEGFGNKSVEEIDAEIARIEAQMSAPQALPPSREVAEIINATSLSPTDDTASIKIDPPKVEGHNKELSVSDLHYPDKT